MADEDYSEEELINIIDELLTVHTEKLKPVEITFLNTLTAKIEDGHLYNNLYVTSEDRDIVIAMYDRMGEGGY